MAWNGSNSAGASAPAPKKPAKKSPGLTHGLIAGAAIVLIGVISLYFVTSEPDEPTVEKRGPTQIAEVEADIYTVKAVTNEDSSVCKGETRSGRKISKIVMSRASSPGRVMTMRDGTVVTNTVKAVFNRDFENALMYALRPGGFGASRLLHMRQRYSDFAILNMLKEITSADAADDEQTRIIKENVQQLKESILLEISKGKTVSDVFDMMIRQSAFERNVDKQVDDMRREAIRSGDPDDVRKTVEETNEFLQKCGLKPKPIPLQYRERIAELEKEESERVAGNELNLQESTSNSVDD